MYDEPHHLIKLGIGRAFVSVSLLLLFVILIAIILISGYFSASEISIMSINRYKLRHLVKKGHKQAIRVNTLLQRPDKVLSVVIIGNTLANIIASTVATLLGERLGGAIGVAIATAILSLAILVVSEMMPKTLAALYSQQVAFAISWSLQTIQKLMTPLVWLISSVTNISLRLFGVRIDHVQREALNAEELRSVVNEAGSLLPIEHKSMLVSLLDLQQATVEDIMIPVADIVGIDIQKSWFDIYEELETTQHTRLLLFRESVDQLVGTVHVRSILALALEERLDLDNLINLAEKPYFTPEGTLLSNQLVHFQREKKRSCFVVNEYGDLLGMVTMEDILEEVVGEFTTDMAALCKDIIPQEDNTVIVDASITLRHLKRMMGWQLPSIGPRTLSGLIIEHLGYIPPADCCLSIENYRIEILKVSDNMIKTVRMYKC